jgi:hypothetical protein
MSSGSAVFKVESKMTNAYIEQEVSGVHFVSIMSNLSDLAERTQMVTDDSYLPVLERISENAKLLASSFTYEQEVDRVAREIRKNWIEHRKGANRGRSGVAATRGRPRRGPTSGPEGLTTTGPRRRHKNERRVFDRPEGGGL